MPTFESFKSYQYFNNEINGVIFDGRFAGAPLYLEIEGAIANDVAQRMRKSPAEFIAGLSLAAVGSLDFAEADPFSWHTAMEDRWKKSGRADAPPFTALLSALSVAAERMRRDNRFEAHNYYQRLFDYLGISDETSKHKIRANFKSTRRYWKELNQWLSDKEFQLGRPTAQQINGFPYVSYAVSQALIRDAERQNIYQMFADAHLAPGERLTSDEMRLYLQKWVAKHQATAWLAQMWKLDDARISEAVCHELEAWIGTEIKPAAGTAQVYSLSWAAHLRRFPTPSIHLHLTLPSAAAVNLGRIDPLRCLNASGRRILEGCADEIELVRMDEEGLMSLQPSDKIRANELFQETFEIENEIKTIKLQKSARGIIPLAKLDSGGFFKEVSRLSLLRPHLILCHQQWHKRVAIYLRQAARPGFKEFTASDLRGLPVDWVAFDAVEIVRVLNDQPNDLLTLVPLIDTTIEPQRGIRLFDETWHENAVPEILVAASEGPIQITFWRDNETGKKSVLAQQNSEDSCACLDLRTINDLTETRGIVAVSQGTKLLKERRLMFASANSARSLTVLSVPPLRYQVSTSHAWGLYSAEPVSTEDPRILSVTGMVVSGSASVPPQSVGEGGRLLDTAIPSFERDDEFEINTFLTDRTASGSQTCLTRGHHVWICQSFEKGDSRTEAKWMSCQDCTSRVLSRNRGKRVVLAPALQRTKISAPPRLTPAEEWFPSVDLLFDALCYLGASRWSRFAEICGQGSDDPWFLSRLATNLMVLGHIDFQIEILGSQPKVWRCAPPAAILLPENCAFLSGFRSKSFLQNISSAVTAVGGSLLRLQQEYSPAAYIVKNVSPDALASAFVKVRDPLGRGVAIVQNPAKVIALSAPNVEMSISSLQDTYFKSGESVERFDPRSGRWTVVSNTNTPGAYRSVHAYRVYAFRDHLGLFKRVPYGLGKILAAKSVGLRLHGFNAQTNEFIAAIGCEPPPLFERALVACSGLLPRKANGRLLYSNVSATVATAVIERLYGGT